MANRDSVERLFDALEGATVRALRRQNRLSVATSGGLDSSVLAAFLARHADIPLQLVTVSVPGAADAPRARALADHLGLPLVEVVVTPSRLRAILPSLVQSIGRSRVEPELAAEWGVPPTTEYVNPVRTAWEAPIFFATREASRHAKRVVLGQGADELFAGYGRYQPLERAALRPHLERDLRALQDEILPIEARIAAAHQVQPHYPYLDAGVQAAARALADSDLIAAGVRKVALRAVARRLELPAAIVDMPKTAAQYGSGVGALLAQLAREAGLRQGDYLTGLLPSEAAEIQTPSARNA